MGGRAPFHGRLWQAVDGKQRRDLQVRRGGAAHARLHRRMRTDLLPLRQAPTPVSTQASAARYLLCEEA